MSSPVEKKPKHNRDDSPLRKLETRKSKIAESGHILAQQIYAQENPGRSLGEDLEARFYEDVGNPEGSRTMRELADKCLAAFETSLGTYEETKYVLTVRDIQNKIVVWTSLIYEVNHPPTKVLHQMLIALEKRPRFAIPELRSLFETIVDDSADIGECLAQSMQMTHGMPYPNLYFQKIDTEFHQLGISWEHVSMRQYALELLIGYQCVAIKYMEDLISQMHPELPPCILSFVYPFQLALQKTKNALGELKYDLTPTDNIIRVFRGTLLLMVDIVTVRVKPERGMNFKKIWLGLEGTYEGQIFCFASECQCEYNLPEYGQNTKGIPPPESCQFHVNLCD